MEKRLIILDVITERRNSPPQKKFSYITYKGVIPPVRGRGGRAFWWENPVFWENARQNESFENTVTHCIRSTRYLLEQRVAQGLGEKVLYWDQSNFSF